jgi:hypothetical protein
MGFHKDSLFNQRDLNTLRKLYYQFNELIYLCNSFDINSINKFLINIIENHDFIIKEDGIGELSNKYSDMSDFNKLSGDIIVSDEYNNMINYMNFNFRMMYTKYEKYLKKIGTFNTKYITYIKETEDDVDTIKKIKYEYKIVISNLEELQVRFSELDIKNIITDTIDGIKIDVVLITNNSITYNVIGYWVFKKFLYRNLHIIDKDSYEITNSDINEFKNKFHEIYSKVHKDFIDKYKNGYAKQFDETLINSLKSTIADYRKEAKKAEENAEDNAKKKEEKAKIEKEEKNNEINKEKQASILEAKKKELLAQTAELKYNDQQSIVNNFRNRINKLENPTIETDKSDDSKSKDGEKVNEVEKAATQKTNVSEVVSNIVALSPTGAATGAATTGATGAAPGAATTGATTGAAPGAATTGATTGTA